MQSSSETPQKNNWINILGHLLVGTMSLWMPLLAGLGLVVAIFSGIFPTDASDRMIIFFNLALAGGTLIPALPMAIWWPNRRIRRVFSAWVQAAGLSLLFCLVATLPNMEAIGQALVRSGLAISYGLLVWLWLSRAQVKCADQPRNFPLSQVLLAATTGIVILYPWLAWGALGSSLDTLVQLGSALAISFAASMLIESGLEESHAEEVQGLQLADRLGLDGFLAAGVLGILLAGSAFPYGFLQLFMLGLPFSGFMLAALRGAGKPGNLNAALPGFILVGLCLVGPFLFVDADELMAVIAMNPGDLMGYIAQSAAVSTILGLLGSVIGMSAALALPWLRKVGTWLRTSLAFGTLALAIAGGAAIYMIAGQPGLYGESLFVILSSQADLSDAAMVEDPTARRQAVYRALTEHAEASQAALRAELDEAGIAYQPYYLVNAIEVRGDLFTRLWLEKRADVYRVLDNPRLRPLPEIPEPVSGWEAISTDIPWNLTMIEANQVWSELGVRGAGIVIGQSDSGVDGNHPELASQYRGANGELAGQDYNWFDPWYSSSIPRDIGGHGTHTLGSILGKNVGVAPEASWIGCVNLARNLGNPALYLDCMQFMLAPFPAGGDPLRDGRAELGAHVINNSWGCPDVEGCDANALLPAVDALRIAGVFVVASAGNDGPACGSLGVPPALYDSVFSVGAIDEQGDLASFSSIGPVSSDGSGRIKPDILAPGDRIFSSMPNGTYGIKSGTSMAGPHVAGVVALMWSANPALIGDIEQTEAILQQTASPYTGALPACPGVNQVPSTASGYGMVNAKAAVEEALRRR